jgi:voltage-gated potassium channel Kch
VQDAGRELAKVFEAKDQSAMLPTDTETQELNNHVIILGFGRVGQTIAQLLSERLIPFVALDVRGERVAAGQAADLPVYFGDAGSPQVLSHLNAHKARCAVITLDTPGANYRAVWAMNKHFPNAKIYVRAHDVKHGLNLEKAGATAGAFRSLCFVSLQCQLHGAKHSSAER